VKERVSALGGTVSIETTPGKGTQVRILVPDQASRTRLIVYVRGRAVLALPAQFVTDTVPSDAYREDRQECDIGSAAGAGPPPFRILVDRGEDRFALAADEVLYERDVQQPDLVLDAEVHPGVYRVRLSGEDPGFLYLDPRALSANHARPDTPT
jgi:chemotaxis protein histidine kinase CheA